LGSFSFSSSFVGSGCAASGASVKENNTEYASVRVVIEILEKRSYNGAFSVL
jgi:hypothetical protein